MRYLITAGPTREPIDAVRYISNRSSGRMGAALAAAAAAAGHDVTLLLGPGAAVSEPPSGAAPLRFVTAADLQSLLREHWPHHDVLVMAAAVGDYTVAQPAPGKLERAAADEFTLRLTPTPDLAAHAAAHKRPGQRVIAFALEEPAGLRERAAQKLKRKAADAIVANPLDTMDADTIDPLWLTAAGDELHPGAMSKKDFAAWLVRQIDAMV